LSRPPHKIGELPNYLHTAAPLIKDFERDTTQVPLRLPIGQLYDDLSVYCAEFSDVSGHLFAIGRRFSGKTSLLQTTVLQAADLYSPEELRIVLIAPDPKSAARLEALAVLPHVREKKVISTVESLGELIAEIGQMYQALMENDTPLSQRMLIVIDEAQDLFNQGTVDFLNALKPSLARKPEEQIPRTMPQQAALFSEEWAAKGAAYGLYFAVAYRYQSTMGTTQAKFPVQFLTTLKQNSTTCVTSHKNAVVLGVADYKKISRIVRFDRDAGRGFVFTEGNEPEVVQFATPMPENQSDFRLSEHISNQLKQPKYLKYSIQQAENE
jgi:hypothetical protein